MSKRRNSSKLSWLIGGGILVIASSALYYITLPDSLVYFYTPSEAMAATSDIGERTIRVGGMVKVGSIDNQPNKPLVTFTLWDMKETEFAVTYQGIPPDMFKENQGVVVEGRMTGPGTLVARNLLVKHSEEYKTPDSHHSMNKELLEKSLFKE